MELLRTLKQCLIDLDLARLRVIARLWGLELTATRPLEAADEMARKMVGPENAAELWESLSEDQREALWALQEGDGVMASAVFRRRFGEIRPIGPGRLEREAPWREPVSPAEGLWYRGMIHEGFAGEGDAAYPVFFIPTELQAALPRRTPEGGGRVQVPLAPAPQHGYGGADPLLDDLTTMLSFVHNEVVQTRGEAPGTRPAWAEKRLARHLRDPDETRREFMWHLIAHLGWTRKGATGRLRLAPEPVMAWLQGSADQQQAQLVDGWRGLQTWDELWRLTALTPDRAGTWRHDPTLAREVVLRTLRALPPGAWVRTGDFVGAIKEADPDFQRPGGDYDSWYVRDGASGDYLKGFESWERVEGALLRAVLRGPAFWLGLVELGVAETGEVPALIRPLTGGGKETNGGGAMSAQPYPTSAQPHPEPVVRADLTVTLPAERRFERFQLARVAELVRVEDGYVYRLLAGSLGRARRQGIEIERVLEFLEGLSEAPIPQPVRASLTRWAEQGTEIWLERAVVLRVSEEAVLDRIAKDPKLGHFLTGRVSPTAALVEEGNWPRLLEGLAALGLLAEVKGLEP